MPVNQVTATINGRPLVIETGKYAKQAGGAVTVRYGDTIVFAAATVAKTTRPGIDFFPLTVDFEERLYAAGKIPGSFPRREGRPSEEGILTARLVDRPIRPLWPKGFKNDVQIIVSAWSSDQENDYDVLAVNAASAALTVSNAPFEGPIGCVRVGTVDGKLVLNPTIQQVDESDLDLVVAGTRDSVMMIEAGARQVSEDLLVEALALAQQGIKEICEAQEKLRQAAGKPKIEYVPLAPDMNKLGPVKSWLAERLRAKLRNPDKAQRESGLDELKLAAVAQFAVEGGAITADEVAGIYEEGLEEEFRRAVTEENLRPDGRDTKTIRPLSIEVGVLPRTHGSGLFTRGQTQVLSIATLGPTGDEQIIDTLSPVDTKRYMHHYNFPPYSVGEVRMMRGAGRREIGHGALAERAISPMLPDETVFPYTIRVVSEVLESNGSSSMATVCGGSLSLMDAGVPIKAPVAGIAMGLVKEGDKVAILTDILGDEDHLGDMDFKVAGTAEGVTAIQMDNKAGGITREVLRSALHQARDARLFILGVMDKAIAAPRKELSSYAPRIVTIHIKPDKIRDVIGPGGKVIRALTEETGCKIDIEDDGTVLIASSDGASLEKAIAAIQAICTEPEVGKIYHGRVRKIVEFGAFVEILPGTDGLLHISQLSEERVRRVEDVVHEGDEIDVKVLDVDRSGKIRLSLREAKQDLAQAK